MKLRLIGRPNQGVRDWKHDMETRCSTIVVGWVAVLGYLMLVALLTCLPA